MTDTYDSPWKQLLENYLPEFLAFFFPAIRAEIDWSRGYESLDKGTGADRPRRRSRQTAGR